MRAGHEENGTPMRRRRTGRRRVLAAVIGGALAMGAVAGCDLTPAETTPSRSTPPAQFVTAQGQQLMQHGKPLTLAGFNLFDAAASSFYQCEPQWAMSDQALRTAFKQYKEKAGANVMRFWAYQPFTKGGKDFTGIDRVITAAKAEGMLVIPVLEDGPGYCTTGTKAQPKTDYRGDTYYTEGYKQKYGSASLSLLDYAKVMAEHYKNEPTIAAWMIMNEAETKRRSADGRTALVDMARTVAQAIRKADTNHLVTLGTQGNGAPGNSGSDFKDIYSLSELDYVEVHDWGYYGSDTEAMPGAQEDGSLPAADSEQCQDKAAKIACSFAIAKALNKPIIVGEVGIKATDAAAVARRATLIDAKMQAAKKFGAAGYILWEANTFAHEGYGIEPGSNDPVMAVLARF